jgi:3-oxoadipate CoA-transferase alpha subunit
MGRYVINKVFAGAAEAVADIQEGTALLVGGFGEAGVPRHLIAALVERGIGQLTLISNNCGSSDDGVGKLFKHGLVCRAKVSFPLQPGNNHFMDAFRRGEVELEVIPQGTLVGRLYAAGAGFAGFYTPTAVGTILAGDREVRHIDGRDCLLELPLRGDVALIRAAVADEAGNLRYRRAMRNFNPVMARAATLTIAEVDEIVPVGSIDPDDVHTPGVYVDRVVKVGS